MEGVAKSASRGTRTEIEKNRFTELIFGFLLKYRYTTRYMD